MEGVNQSALPDLYQIYNTEKSNVEFPWKHGIGVEPATSLIVLGAHMYMLRGVESFELSTPQHFDFHTQEDQGCRLKQEVCMISEVIECMGEQPQTLTTPTRKKFRISTTSSKTATSVNLEVVQANKTLKSSLKNIASSQTAQFKDIEKSIEAYEKALSSITQESKQNSSLILNFLRVMYPPKEAHELSEDEIALKTEMYYVSGDITHCTGRLLVSCPECLKDMCCEILEVQTVFISRLTSNGTIYERFNSTGDITSDSDHYSYHEPEICSDEIEIVMGYIDDLIRDNGEILNSQEELRKAIRVLGKELYELLKLEKSVITLAQLQPLIVAYKSEVDKAILASELERAHPLAMFSDLLTIIYNNGEGLSPFIISAYLQDIFEGKKPSDWVLLDSINTEKSTPKAQKKKHRYLKASSEEILPSHLKTEEQKHITLYEAIEDLSPEVFKNLTQALLNSEHLDTITPPKATEKTTYIHRHNDSLIIYWNGSYCGQLCNESEKGKHGKRHGQGTMIYENGAWYAGGWKYGAKDGLGIMKLSDGSIYIGSWKQGQMHGIGKFFKSNSEVYYSGEWENGKRHGFGVAMLSDGGKYSGYWTHGKRTGTGEINYPHGLTLFGTWRDDNLDGFGIKYIEDKVLYVGNWKNGEQITSREESEQMIYALKTKSAAPLVHGISIQTDNSLAALHEKGNQTEHDNKSQSTQTLSEKTIQLRDSPARKISRQLSWPSISSELPQFDELNKTRSLVTNNASPTKPKKAFSCSELDKLTYKNDIKCTPQSVYLKYVELEYEDGIYRGEFFCGERYGKGSMSYKNGDYYDGKWDRDQRHGLGYLITENGDSYEGEWEGDMKHGVGYYTTKSGKTYLGIWKLNTFIININLLNMNGTIIATSKSSKIPVRVEPAQKTMSINFRESEQRLNSMEDILNKLEINLAKSIKRRATSVTMTAPKL